MSQSLITFTYSLEDVLTRIEGKIDKLEGKIEKKLEDVNQKIEKLQIGQVRLEEKVDGLSERIDSQEFISRGVLMGLIVTILGGLAKLFGFAGNP